MIFQSKNTGEATQDVVTVVQAMMASPALLSAMQTARILAAVQRNGVEALGIIALVKAVLTIALLEMARKEAGNTNKYDMV